MVKPLPKEVLISIQMPKGTKSGIILVADPRDNYKKSVGGGQTVIDTKNAIVTREADVLAVGKGVKSVKRGDVVIVNKLDGRTFEFDCKNYTVLDEDLILAKYAN